MRTLISLATWKEPDGWYARVYRNFRVEWLKGPFRSSNKAYIAAKEAHKGIR